MPRVAVIITCFNLGRFLEEAIDSVNRQTFTDIELIVVDDGSTDPHTKALISGDRLAGIRVICTENRGLSAARNVGLAATSGEYVCAVDADDILEPRLLERSVSHLDADPSVAFVSHWLEAFGDQSWEWKPTRCDFPALLASNTVNGAALVRRSALAAVGGWDETLREGCEDWDLWVSLVERGFRGEIIPEVLFRYRQRPDSMSRVRFAGDGHARLYRQLIDKHADTFRTYLQDLVVQRACDLAGMRALSEDLEEGLDLRVLPSLARAHDDLRDAERRVRGEYAAENASLRDENRVLRDSLERTREETLRVERERSRVEALNRALYASLSWRVTKPLRSLRDLADRASRWWP